MQTTTYQPMALCRVCNSRLDERIRTRGRHWNCELADWQHERDTRTVVGSRHLISTAVRWCRCGCGGWVLAAIAEGLTESVDPAIVDEHTELNEMLRGRRSFDVIRIGGRTELMYRDQWRQKTRDYPVALAHNCGHILSLNDPLDVVNEKMRRGKTTTPPQATPAPATGAAQPPPF
jgi:hypothetical protein